MTDDVRIKDIGGNKYIVESGVGESEIKTGPLSWEKAQKRAQEMRLKNRKIPPAVIILGALLVGVFGGLGALLVGGDITSILIAFVVAAIIGWLLIITFSQ